MGKSSRKKKQKKSDFQKVKLKIGKKKPMPDNFTRTAFKSQSIQLKEQLQTSASSVPQTQRKQNINDLICHINHYNAKVRQSSLIGLKELLTSNIYLIQDNLALLIQNVAHSFTDKDGGVRQAGFAVLQCVVKNIRTSFMVPFFPAMCAHLCCAMTHLQEDIQLDALKILDLLLANYPDLVISKSEELLTNFILQISRHSGRNKKGAVQLELSTTPGSKFAGQKWRIQVLQRLKAFLSAIVNSKVVEISTKSKNCQPMGHEVIVSGSTEVHCGIYKSSYSNINTSNEDLVLRSPTFSKSDFLDFTSNLDEVKAFVIKVVPLLLQCWTEARPSYHSNQRESIAHTSSSFETLSGVLSVVQLLWKWTEVLCQEQEKPEVLTELQDTYQKSFLASFFDSFPYTREDVNLKKHPHHKQKASIPSVSDLEVNLLTCEVMSYFVKKGHKQSWASQLLRYVKGVLENKKLQVSTEQAQTLLEVVTRMMKSLNDKGSKVTLLQALVQFYKNSHLMSQNKRLAMTCIADMTILDSFHQHGLSDSEVISNFIQTLPSLLIQLGSKSLDTSHHALQIIHQSAAMAHSNTVLYIQEHFEDLLDLKSKLVCDYPERLQRELVELLQWVQKIRLSTFQKLCSTFMNPQVFTSVVAYAIQILTCKHQDLRLLRSTILSVFSLRMTLDLKSKLVCDYPERLQRELVELLQWVQRIRLSTFQKLCSTFMNPQVFTSVVAHAIQILTCKLLKRHQDLPYEVNDFVSFLFTMTLGYQREELFDLNTSGKVSQNRLILPDQSTHLCLVSLKGQDMVSRHHTVCKVVCQALRLISEQLTWRLYQEVTSKLLIQLSILPFSSAYGILFTVHECFLGNEDNADFVSQFSQLVVSVLYCTVQDYTTEFVEGGWEEALWSLAIKTIKQWKVLLQEIFSLLQVGVKYHTDMEQLRLMATVVIRILQTEELKQIMVERKQMLEDFMRTFMVSSQHMEESRWLAELRYEASLFLGPHENT
ncbi:Testis-expressed protein 10-like [Holothuria leucospilota]|uniref:Testis-expressed protein 10-like n=1 Tax=Holothuria leucospilota TaxID=206669 RepID=A0A9Q0YP10_HOLLE|nr:Testis-expressed protein 10-like [Holothuria leucospilota]